MDILGNALSTLNAIRIAVKAVKAKEKQCQTLCERSERAVASLQALGERTGGKLEPGAHEQALAFAK